MAETCVFPDSGRAVLRCAGCGHLMLQPQPSDEQLAALYGGRSYFSGPLAALHDDLAAGFDVGTPIARLYARHLDRIAAVTPPRARMLEVGSGRGAFGHLAAARGYDVTVTDRNPHGVEYAIRHFGLRGVTGEFESVELDGPFDVVAAFDVIEHVRDPRAFIERVSALLTPGGIAAIGTPNAHSPLIRVATLMARVTAGRWHYPLWRLFGDGAEHLHLLSETGLERMARRAGLEAIGAYGYAIPPGNLRASLPGYAFAARIAALYPYETVLIARKK